MILTFKVTPNSQENSWIGWFGENIIKVRLTSPRENLVNSLCDFITADLGIQSKDMQLLSSENTFVSIEFPDVAWELFLSILKK